MRTTKTLLTVLIVASVGLSVGLLTAVSASAQTDDATPATHQHGYRFIDEDGDGFNDNAPDADGDGIPNGQDPDYVKPEDGTGQHKAWSEGNGTARKGKNRQVTGGEKYRKGKRHGSGDGDGTGTRDRNRLRDGSEGGGQYGPGTRAGNGNRGTGGRGKGKGSN